MGVAGHLRRLTGRGFMRLFLPLCVAILALAAWLAIGSGREPRPDANVPAGTSSTTAEPPASVTALDPVAAPDRSAPSREVVAPPSVERAGTPSCRVFGRVVGPRGAVVPD